MIMEIEMILRERPVLQVALDLIELDRALKIAEEVVKEDPNCWLEVGTPLIKAEGMNAVRIFRKKFPRQVIVADLKTMDTGRLEAEMAFKAGANIVVILGVADNSTIKEAIEAARNFGGYVMVDIMNCENPVQRSVELEKLGVDIICVHIGIDQQMKGMNPLDVLKAVREKVSCPLAIAGGITSETAGLAVKYGADVIIVGGFITKSLNPGRAAKLIKEAMLKEEVIKAERGVKAKTLEEAIEIFKKVSVPNISDAMHRAPIILGFKPVVNKKIIGRAVTVRTYPGDWAKPVEAIDVCKPGDVLVIDAGNKPIAVWGELASLSAKIKGLAGVIVYGGVRDLDGIRKIDFPVYATHFVARAGEPKGFGEINVPIEIEGIKIRPGDIIVASEEGIIVIPKEKALEIANRALDVKEKEERIWSEIEKGSTLAELLDLYKWEKVFG